MEKRTFIAASGLWALLLCACSGNPSSDNPDAAGENPDLSVTSPDGGSDLGPSCPCPKESYCNLVTNRCVSGCIDNSQCNPGRVCDLMAHQCMPATNPCPSGMFCASMIADQTFELNSTGTAITNVLSSNAYSGTVNITVQRATLDALSGGTSADVGIAVMPATVMLQAGTPVPLTVNFSTTTAAAAFNAQTFTLHLQDAMDATQTFDLPVKLTVLPRLTITFKGAGTGANLHTWSTDKGATINFNVRQRPIVAGVGGTTLVFLNKDTGPPIIHGSGRITHQNTGGTGTPPNGTHTVPNVNDVTNTNTNTDGFYCHTHNTNGSNPAGERFITFIP